VKRDYESYSSEQPSFIMFKRKGGRGSFQQEHGSGRAPRGRQHTPLRHRSLEHPVPRAPPCSAPPPAHLLLHLWSCRTLGQLRLWLSHSWHPGHRPGVLSKSLQSKRGVPKCLGRVWHVPVLRLERRCMPGPC